MNERVARELIRALQHVCLKKNCKIRWKDDARRVDEFGPQLGAMPCLDIRKKVLEDVVARSQATDGLGRLKGKVGVITGVGPEMGIGVCVFILSSRQQN